ncbi:MAG: hypothetical protein ACT4O3_08485 [Elusimicrobiota bacterium]
MDPETKRAVHSLIFAVLYLLLFVILLPPLIRVLDQTWGRVLYGAMVAGGVAVAFRLRHIARKS